MPAPQTVLTLIENFERNLDAYRNGKYNETQVRLDFINPFFKALGWDMDNSAGYAEAYRDVIHEDAIKVGISTRAPDYSFRVGGQRKFFLEAKKPSVNVKDDVEPAFQLRRYAWSAKLPLSIVTDFEEFAIYDCRQKPDKNDKASKSRLFYCTFHDYAEKWDEIAAIFSPDAIKKGSFDKYAVSTKGKRGTTEVDSAFLEEIEDWRNLLAHNIALRNANLSQRELNFAVQQTIDRIIFLRICEDRGIETYGRLMALQNGVNVYGRLRELFRAADDRYNSGLFHFKREKGREEAPDELTLNLAIDDKPLKEIFKNLYYPDCPYEFSVLGADILGSVYEQFLGKVIRLTAGNRAVVEDKPEVKKAGGVYYTPTYIVDYIVAHTVGKLLEDKSAKQAAGITVLDPACGSGSFLIGAYQYLLDWYLARYVEEGAEKHSKGKTARIYSAVHGEWRLTTAEKKRILLEHIYGVDIDTQAVEVTKLSLLLKVLEGESGQTLNAQMKLFHERVLPDLERNIQCGNSLISPDFNVGQLDLDMESMQLMNERINVFNWHTAFPQIFKVGGFDAVIGNPPWVTVEKSVIGESVWNYFKSKYRSIDVFKMNYFPMFVEKGVSLTNKSGYLGMILPNRLLDTPSYKFLREILVKNTLIKEIVDLPKGEFKGVVAGNIILTLFKGKNEDFEISRNIFKDGVILDEYKTEKRNFEDIDNELFCINLNQSLESSSVITKMENDTLPLKHYFMIHVGMMVKNKNESFLEHKFKDSTPIVTGRNFGKFTHPQKQYFDFDNAIIFGGTKRREKHETTPKILIRKTGNTITATVDNDGVYAEQSVYLVLPRIKADLLFMLGLINSKLMNYYFRNKLITNPESYPYIQHYDLEVLPIKSANEKTTEFISSLVNKMLALHQQLAAAKTPQDNNLLQRQIDATDKQIDQLVYALYGLTDEEIALVENT
jgi:type I restriction-modification system DNA methylase subunit/predicted type IV restriction endonuclease